MQHIGRNMDREEEKAEFMQKINEEKKELMNELVVEQKKRRGGRTMKKKLIDIEEDLQGIGYFWKP